LIVIRLGYLNKEPVMATSSFFSRVRFMIVGLIALWAFGGFLSHMPASAQPQPFLSPQQIPSVFLSVPYYGARGITAYVDHDPLGVPLS
jgi:hypothetical protein